MDTMNEVWGSVLWFYVQYYLYNNIAEADLRIL